MLVECLCFGVGLIYDEYPVAFGIRANEYVYMVAVRPFCAFNVTIVIVERITPFAPCFVDTQPNTPFRVLYRYLKTIKPDMSFVIIASHLLSFGRICIGHGCRLVYGCGHRRYDLST